MELDIERERLVRIRLAGLLHDVGKIGVPDSILQKHAALTNEEYEQMKAHSVLGAAIIEAADMPIEALWVRRHSGTQFDGNVVEAMIRRLGPAGGLWESQPPDGRSSVGAAPPDPDAETKRAA
jgi:HD-GYP domain-containing protein (c-di-GMP phosphodiesterase class II)